MVTSRERVNLALQHKEADRVSLDLGGTSATGIHVDTLYLLRQALGLDKPGTPVRVVEPLQMLGEIKPDLLDALGGDTVPLWGTKTLFGFASDGWKPWTTFAGTPVLVPEAFNTVPEPNGDVFLYPEGDRSAPPTGHMPKDGFYFDVIDRPPAREDVEPDLEDNMQEYGPISESELEYFRREAERLYQETDKAIVATFGGTSFGRFPAIPGPMLKYPKGIRNIADWFMSSVTRRSFVYQLFEQQCELALRNLARIYEAVGNRIAVVVVTTTDFGAQLGPLISPGDYRDLYKPFHKRVNDWIHQYTTWKTFTHSCGSVWALLDDFVDAGFDILNPVQCSAANMNPATLKSRYGERLTFWGGGVDTQRTLPFGTPDEVRHEVRERLRIFGVGGGFVFNPVHNIQARTPIENVLAMFETVREFSCYPV